MATKDISDKQVLEAYRQYEESPHLPNKTMAEWSYFCAASHGDVLVERFPPDYLQEITGQPKKVCQRAMERAHRRGLIEYASSLRTGQATQKGIDLYFSR